MRSDGKMWVGDGLSARAQARQRWWVAEEGEKERGRMTVGLWSIYKREGVEAKPNGAWGRSDWARSARWRGGSRRRRRCAWKAACRLAKGPGVRGVRGNGQLECQAACLGGPGGPDGRERRPQMEIGTYLQFLKSQGPLSKLKFSLFFRAQMIKC